MSDDCPDARLQELLVAMSSGETTGLDIADRLISEYPLDARLHFLRGSILAGCGLPLEAVPALQQAIELAPDFAVARFQLGFLQLTSGDATEALAAWGPLALLPEENYLRKFADGLTYLARDDFAAADRLLREGMTLNDENPPLNRDMLLILEQIQPLLSEHRTTH